MSHPSPLHPLLGLGDLTPAELERLATRHGIRDENDLAAACRTNRLRDDPGFGLSRQVSVHRALRQTPWATPRRPLAEARAAAARILGSLQDEDTAVRLAAVGDVRRMCPWVSKVELLASAHEPERLLEAFAGLSPLASIEARSLDAIEGRLIDGLRIDLTVLPEDPGTFAVAVLDRTGPPAHVAALRARAAARGLRLDAAGVHDENGLLPLAWEPDVYAALGLAAIPPELRGADVATPPPDDLVSMHDIRGLAHVHTDAGAGSAPVAGYARAAHQNGFGWLLLADRDLDGPRLALERAAADAVHATPDLPVRVFVGAEVRVDADGRLVGAPALLAQADLLVAAVEEAPGESSRAEDPTPRYLAAIRDPRVRVLAHPRSPTLCGPARDPDWARLWPALAETGTALELSGESARLELPPEQLRAGLQAGVVLLPAADAHDLGGIDRALVAVGQARRAAARVSEVLATLSAEAFAEWIAR